MHEILFIAIKRTFCLQKNRIYFSKLHTISFLYSKITGYNIKYETGGESKCVAIQIISTNMHTSTRVRITFTSIFMMESISTRISAAING